MTTDEVIICDYYMLPVLYLYINILLFSFPDELYVGCLDVVGYDNPGHVLKFVDPNK